jgi:hypothetical protein
VRILLDIKIGQPGEPIRLSVVDTPTEEDFADLLVRGKAALPELAPVDELGLNDAGRLYAKGHKGPIPFELDFGLAKSLPG